MPKYRVEVTETTSTTREEWFTAPTEDDAKAMAEAGDWREWQKVGQTHTECGVTQIEEVEG